MPKKVNLPLFEEIFDRAAGSGDPRSAGGAPASAKKPTLEVARRRLGGKPDADAGAGLAGFTPGTVVEVEGRAAVVLFATRDEVHVLFDPKLLKKVTPDRVDARAGEAPADLAQLAGDAGVFGVMTEGQWVRYADDKGELREGKLVEKCRYGALVARVDGAIVAVGFRKLWPAPGTGEA